MNTCYQCGGFGCSHCNHVYKEFKWNCTENGEEPDWSLYDVLEVATCQLEHQGRDEYWNRVEPKEYNHDLRSIHTLYGHLPAGGVEALHDFTSPSECLAFAEKLGLEIKVDWLIHVCSECKSQVDPNMCHCGITIKDHKFVYDHGFVPFGCTCGYVKEG